MNRTTRLIGYNSAMRPFILRRRLLAITIACTSAAYISIEGTANGTLAVLLLLAPSLAVFAVALIASIPLRMWQARRRRLASGVGTPFSLSLRGLLLLFVIPSAGLSAWVAYNVSWIRERHRFLDQHAADIVSTTRTCNAPGTLWLLSEQGMSECVVRERFRDQPEEFQRAARLFPEADIEWRADDGLSGGGMPRQMKCY